MREFVQKVAIVVLYSIFLFFLLEYKNGDNSGQHTKYA